MATEQYSTLLASHHGSVMDITLNRPDVRNALDETLIAELTQCVLRAGETGCRALVLRGAGPVFSAGADLNWMARAAAFTEEQNLEDARKAQQLFAGIAHFPGATIAVVQGAAFGGGVGLAAVCDIAIADEAAVFALSEVRLGLAPAIVAPYIIEKIGPGAARALFVTGERFDSATALRIGLIQHITSGEQEREQRVVALLTRILEAGPQAIAAAKSLIRAVTGKSPDEAAEATATCIAGLRAGAEGQEGVGAFLEKRPPSFVEALPEK